MTEEFPQTVSKYGPSLVQFIINTHLAERAAQDLIPSLSPLSRMKFSFFCNLFNGLAQTLMDQMSWDQALLAEATTAIEIEMEQNSKRIKLS